MSVLVSIGSVPLAMSQSYGSLTHRVALQHLIDLLCVPIVCRSIPIDRWQLYIISLELDIITYHCPYNTNVAAQFNSVQIVYNRPFSVLILSIDITDIVVVWRTLTPVVITIDRTNSLPVVDVNAGGRVLLWHSFYKLVSSIHITSLCV